MGRLILTLRIGETAVIDTGDGRKVRVEYVKAIGQQKGSLRIEAPEEFGISREERPAK